MASLDYFKNHPLRVPKDQSQLPISAIIAACETTVIEPDIHPTAGAFIHYGGVELADMLTLTQPTVPDDDLAVMADAWYRSCGTVAKQLLFYLWWIIAKEMRHGGQSMCDKAFASGSHDPHSVAVVEKICGGGSYKEHLTNAGHLPAGPYVSAIEQHYRHGGWTGAFGGKKWADIALVFKRYIYGEVSAMIAADRAWTLVHNTGPIFNKGFYFEYANPIEVLNAQAKHSVFDLGYKYLDTKSGFAHPMNEHFYKFCNLAVKYIKTVKPDYEAGAEGSGGFKDGTVFAPDAEASAGSKKHTFGGYHIYSGERAQAND